MLPLHLLEQRPEFRRGLCPRNARLEPPQQVHLPLALHRLAVVEDVRQIDVRPAPHETRRHHPDDRPHLVVEPQLAPEHRRIAAELPLPEFEPEQRHRLRPRRFVGRRRGPPDQRHHAHHVERVHGAVIPAQALRIALARPRHVGPRRGHHPGKDRVALGDVQELVDAVVAAVAAALPAHVHAHQPAGVLIRERIEDHRVDHAVHRRAAADSQRQRSDRQGRKPAGFRQVADAETDILHKMIQPAKHEGPPVPFYRRGAPGFGWHRRKWYAPQNRDWLEFRCTCEIRSLYLVCPFARSGCLLLATHLQKVTAQELALWGFQ